MLRNSRPKSDWKTTDDTDIWALIGIMFTYGHLKQNMVDVDTIWSTSYGAPVIQCAMSRTRFRELMNALRVDDKATRSDRRARDKFAPIRDLWNEFEVTLRRHYIPGTNITIDEQLVPFRGRCGFLQYLPSKPDKYGMKLFWAEDSETLYPLACIQYLGKEARNPQEEFGKTVTLSLCQPYFGTNRNINADSFFADQDLAMELLNNGLTLVGTVRQNKRFLPPEFVAKNGLQLHESRFGFQKKLTMVTHQSKKANNVTLLSSMHAEPEIDESTRKMKPEIVTYYNNTKGGVDAVDYMAHQFSTKRKTRRWPMAIFANMLDVAGIASYTAWSLKKFGWEATSKCR